MHVLVLKKQNIKTAEQHLHMQSVQTIFSAELVQNQYFPSSKFLVLQENV